MIFFNNRVYASLSLLPANAIEISFNGSERNIDLDTLFDKEFNFITFLKKRTPDFLKNSDLLKFVFKDKNIILIHTNHNNLKIIDTQILIPGTQKTLKFYVRKRECLKGNQISKSYDYWPKNIRKLYACQTRVEDSSTPDCVGPTTRLRVDGGLNTILKGAGNFNERYMIPIGSTDEADHHQKVYSVSLVQRDSGFKEIVKLKQTVAQFQHYLRNHSEFAPYVRGLALPDFQKDRERKWIGLDGTEYLVAYTQMLNGRLGTLGDLTTGENFKYQLNHLKQVYEGWLLLLAAGFFHSDIKSHNIVKNDTGLLLIDFGCTKCIRSDNHHSRDGSPFYMCPIKFNSVKYQDFTRFSPIENDLYGLCLSLILPYLKNPEGQYLKSEEGKSPFSYFLLCRRFFQEYHTAFSVEVGKKYDNDFPMRHALDQMYRFCYSLWNPDEREVIDNKGIAAYLCELARVLEITDVNLIEKAIANSLCTENQQREALDWFEQEVRYSKEKNSKQKDFKFVLQELQDDGNPIDQFPTHSTVAYSSSGQLQGAIHSRH